MAIRQAAAPWVGPAKRSSRRQKGGGLFTQHSISSFSVLLFLLGVAAAYAQSPLGPDSPFQRRAGHTPDGHT